MDDLGDSVGGWSWWTTLTFSDDKFNGRYRDATWSKPGRKFASKAWGRFRNYLELDSGFVDRKPFVRAFETTRTRGVPHIHALIGGLQNQSRYNAWEWWYQRYGMARIVPYQRERGAGFYLCKYVAKQLGDIEISDVLATKRDIDNTS